MADKTESTPLKEPEWKKKALILGGVEKKEVQDSKKALEDKTSRLKESQAKITWDKEHKKQQWDAQKLFTFDLWAEKNGNKESEKKNENFVETQDTKDKKELEKTEGEYREQLKKNYEAEKAEIIGKMQEWKESALNEEQDTRLKKLQESYLSKYVADFDIKTEEKITPEIIKEIAKTIPDWWEKLVLDDAFTSDKDLKTLRGNLLRQLPTPDIEMDKETLGKYKLLFEQKTGLILSEEQIKRLINETKSLREIPSSQKEKMSQEKDPPPIIDGWGTSGQAYEDYVWSHSPTLWEPNLTDANTWYSLESGKKATENAKNAAKTIKESMRKKYWGTEQQPWEFEKYIDRHAQNHPSFSANQPFLLQSLGQQKAYIYYPGGEVVECSATHGAGWINSTPGAKWSSLGSKELIPDSNWPRNGNKILYRTAVKGLEWCNANDLSRLIRIHEQHGSATHGCTWLPLTEMKRFDAAIDAAGGGAQETFK